MSKKPWEVWDDWGDRHGSFQTLAEAEKSARRRVARTGSQFQIYLSDRHVAIVRPDACGRVWVDVLDSMLA